MPVRKVGVFSPASGIRREVKEIFAAAGWLTIDVGYNGDLENGLEEWDAAVVVCSAGDSDCGLRFARHVRRVNGTARIVILAHESSESLAIEAVRLGAEDYLKPPFDLTRLRKLAGTGNGGAGGRCDAAIVGDSGAMARIKHFIGKVALSDSNVLILGETGTGKEMVAEQIWRRGARSGKPFVCVNCSAIPDGLLESELFGYEKGAFTGALTARDGRLAQAHKGTLFLDEIGDMSLLAQAKILRAIESKQVCRLGGMRPVDVDVRIIAATNRDLESMMRESRFRADLYFRLNVARIELPPLRERCGDIPALIDHFLVQFNRTFGASVERLEDSVLRELLDYPWPGNVRELKNVMEIVYLNLDPRQTVVRRLPDQVEATWRKLQDLPGDDREQLLKALLSAHWNVSKAARQLHWSRMTMYRKLAKYNISPERRTPTQRRAAGSDGD